MSIAESHIFLREARFHAFHGVMPQEQTVGADFTVSLRVAVSACPAATSDELTDTISYADLYEVARQEMAIPSKLLEHVANRIGRHIIDRFPQVRSVDVMVTKLNPPMGADCAGAGVELHFANI